jgi:hypothetical protein
MAKKRNPTPFNVMVHGLNCKGVRSHDIMPYLMNCYAEAKKRKKWRPAPVTFDEFKQFVIDESHYMYWSRCEWEFLVGHWPFGSKKMIEDLVKYMREHLHANFDLDDWKFNIDICNIITSDMDKIDVHWQIMQNIDIVTRVLMDNLGIKTTK